MYENKNTGAIKKPCCAFCKGTNHKSFKCNRYKATAVQGRLVMARKEKLCFKCLEKHMSHNCKQKCSHCSGGHHDTLCYAKERNNLQPYNYGPQYNQVPQTTGQVSLQTSSQTNYNNALHQPQSMNPAYSSHDQAQNYVPGFSNVSQGRGLPNSSSNIRG